MANYIHYHMMLNNTKNPMQIFTFKTNKNNILTQFSILTQIVCF